MSSFWQFHIIQVTAGKSTSYKVNNNLRGKVIRINPKTATLFVEPNQKWRASYSMLFPIIDGQKVNERRFIEGVIAESDSD